jgi:hypothetical protein
VRRPRLIADLKKDIYDELMPDGLEEWAFIATIAAGFTTVALSTVVLVQLRLGFRQMRALKEQVDIAADSLRVARTSLEQTAESVRVASRTADAAHEQVEIADRSLEIAMAGLEQTAESVRIASRAADAARDAALETARARIDDHSPRVVVWDWKPQWPPFIDTLSSLTFQNKPAYRLDLTDPSPVDPEREFHFPAEREYFLWFRIYGILKNEGSSSGRVSLDGDARFIEGTSPLFPGAEFHVPPTTGQHRSSSQGYTGHQYVIQPGVMALFEWAAGFPVGIWADQTPELAVEDELRIRLQSASEDGIIDITRIRFGARPLASVEGHDGCWRLTSPDQTGLVTYPSARKYRSIQHPGEEHGAG